MTHEEYQTLIANIVSGGDDVADKGAALLAAIDADANAAAEREKQSAADAETIRGLTDKINQMKAKEFLAKTGVPKEETGLNTEVDKILRRIINPEVEKDGSKQS